MNKFVTISVVDFYTTKLNTIPIIINLDSVSMIEALYERHLSQYKKNCDNFEDYNQQMIEDGTPEKCKAYLKIESIPKNKCVVLTMKDNNQVWAAISFQDMQALIENKEILE